MYVPQGSGAALSVSKRHTPKWYQDELLLHTGLTDDSASPLADV